MRLSEAKALFRKAIDGVYEVLGAAAAISEGEGDMIKPGIHKVALVPLHAGWSHTPTTTTKYVGSRDAAEVFVFSRTALLRLQPYDAYLSRVYLALILYNLAVTVHMEATIRSSSTHFEEGACRLYDMGFNMLKQTGYAKAEVTTLIFY
jgi:hypothetical protein